MAGLENWDQLTPRQRAVFFCCDGLKSNAKLASQKTQAIGICGQDIFDRYYLDNGNEARIKAAYDKRDPRLKQTIVTPYEPVDCFTAGLNGNENMIGKQLRWPLYLQGTSGGDFWLDKRTSAYYCYRKYVRFLKGELIDRQRCYTDFPLIRYTDVILQWAEALIELNEFTPAKNLIDQVRARAHIPGITIGDLDAMREAVRAKKRKIHEDAADRAAGQELLAKAGANLTVDLPEAMLDRTADNEMRMLEQRLSRSNITLEKHCKNSHTTAAALRAGYRDAAERNLRSMLASRSIAEAENITVSTLEVNNEYRRLSQLQDTPEADIRRVLSPDTLAAALVAQKVQRFLLDNADITTVMDPEKE